MKAEEAKRYLEYAGCDGVYPEGSARAHLLSTESLYLLVVGFICVVMLAGIAVYAARSNETSVSLAQLEQSISEDVGPAAPTLQTDDSPTHLDVTWSRASGRFQGHFSQECVPTFYWLLVAFYAGPGG